MKFLWQRRNEHSQAVKNIYGISAVDKSHVSRWAPRIVGSEEGRAEHGHARLSGWLKAPSAEQVILVDVAAHGQTVNSYVH